MGHSSKHHFDAQDYPGANLAKALESSHLRAVLRSGLVEKSLSEAQAHDKPVPRPVVLFDFVNARHLGSRSERKELFRYVEFLLRNELDNIPGDAPQIIPLAENIIVFPSRESSSDLLALRRFFEQSRFLEFLPFGDTRNRSGLRALLDVIPMVETEDKATDALRVLLSCEQFTKRNGWLVSEQAEAWLVLMQKADRGHCFRRRHAKEIPTGSGVWHEIQFENADLKRDTREPLGATREYLHWWREQFALFNAYPVQGEVGRRARERRGYEFQDFLLGLAYLQNAECESPCRTDTGREIDGFVQIEHHRFMLESKWEHNPIGIDKLDGLCAKLNESMDRRVLGLAVSKSGFKATVAAGLKARAHGTVLVSGGEIEAVLRGEITLPELLIEKALELSVRRI